MASISSGGGSGGKKSVDQEIPLIPFIDLLLCCVMFLLVTAVWNELERLDATQQVPSNKKNTETPPEEKKPPTLRVQATGFVIRGADGTEVRIDREGEDYKLGELATKLEETHNSNPAETKMTIAPEDGVQYMTIIAATDAAKGAGFPETIIRDGSSL